MLSRFALLQPFQLSKCTKQDSIGTMMVVIVATKKLHMSMANYGALIVTKPRS